MDDMEFITNNQPVCPYCNYEYRDYFNDGGHQDAYRIEQECPGCNRTYMLTAYTSILFVTKRIL